MADKKELPYLKQVALAAPAFGAKSLLADLPKGTIEQAVERKLSGAPESFGSLLRQGGLGRGGGRALGSAMGILTAPFYLKGIQLAGSKDPTERKKGIGLIAGSGAVAVGQKGLLEGYRVGRIEGLNPAMAAGKGAKLGLFRAVYKLPITLAMAASLVKAHKDKDPSVYKKYVQPALVGGAIGGLSRTAENVFESGAPKNLKALGGALRRSGPAAAGGVAGGLLGGLVLAGAVDIANKFMSRHKEKNSSAAFDDVLMALPPTERARVVQLLEDRLSRMR